MAEKNYGAARSLDRNNQNPLAFYANINYALYMQGKSKEYHRFLSDAVKSSVEKGHSTLIFGPRQVGKTWLIEHCLAGREGVVEIPLQQPSVRQEYERDPSLLIRRIEAMAGDVLVFIDEAQKIPSLFDAVQYLIDKRKAVFVLSGSSARKRRSKGMNLLPGRVLAHRLDPLLWSETGWSKEGLVPEIRIKPGARIEGYDFTDALVYGALPGIAACDAAQDRAEFLRSYAYIYIEEEIRAEALSRNLGAFSRFLELAAIESGTAPNFSNISKESGVSAPAIKEYFSVLEDTLIVERVEPFLKKARKRLFHGNRYFFFDLGVRNALARAPLSPELANVQKGRLFEHAVMLEIIRRIRALQRDFRVCYWRTATGLEVDCVIDCGETVIPIEIKSARQVGLSDVSGLSAFLKEYARIAPRGYVVTMGELPERLSDSVTAVPWHYL
jgi:predicted AAA+ superfamily ATPase